VPDGAVVDADSGGKLPRPPAPTKIFASHYAYKFAPLNYRVLVSGRLLRLSSSVSSRSRLPRT